MTPRDWQLKKNGGQWLLGKAMENFAPIGPAIVSRDEVGDPNNLQLSCKVRTNGSTAAGHVTPCSSLIGWRGAGERGGEAGLQHRAVRLPRGRGGGLGLQVM